MVEIRTINYRWVLEPDGEIHTADVVVGDGSTTYDDTYLYDERIFFYFHDEEEFQLSFEGASDSVPDGVEFVIVSVED